MLGFEISGGTFENCKEPLCAGQRKSCREGSKEAVSLRWRGGKGNLILGNLFGGKVDIAEGVGRVDVICPGLAADCLETLEEIAVQNAHIFRKYGGENFATIPCLNDSAPGMLVIWQMTLRELKGWV